MPLAPPCAICWKASTCRIVLRDETGAELPDVQFFACSKHAEQLRQEAEEFAYGSGFKAWVEKSNGPERG